VTSLNTFKMADGRLTHRSTRSITYCALPRASSKVSGLQLITRLSFSRRQADHPRSRHTDTLFYSCDLELDLDTIIFIHELRLDILNMYLYNKNEVSTARLSKIRAGTDRHNRTYYHAAFVRK